MGYLPIFSNKNLDVHLGGEEGQKAKKCEFQLHLEINLVEFPCHLCTSSDSKILIILAIFCYLNFVPFRPLKVSTTPLSQI